MARRWTSSVSLLLLFLLPAVQSQYTSQTYPDPRTDPIQCKIGLPGWVCDPSEILEEDERRRLMQRIEQLVGVTRAVRNVSPACASRPGANLELLVAVVEKIGTLPLGPIDIEKFANNLKRRLQNYQDVGMCDTTVLIVNSRSDRQVFTVAGRDAQISKEVLRTAFERNIGHFRSARYATGLEGMVEYIAAAYTNAHLVQVPSPDSFPTKPIAEEGIQLVQPFRQAAAKRTPTVEFTEIESTDPPISATPSSELSTFDQIVFEGVPEKERLWVQLIQMAIARCGARKENLGKHVRSLVEEAMAMSLKLISDTNYNQIEEAAETAKADNFGVERAEARDDAWRRLESDLIGPIYAKYSRAIHNASANSPCEFDPSRSIRRRQ